MTDLILSTKSNLKRIVPNAIDILIKVERDHEKILSKIHVHVPGKVLHAEKKAETVWEAIDYSYQAILKQFEKNKTKRQIKRKLRTF
jgi:ribosomal subunit interface protein